MPRQLKEITNFNLGTILNLSEKDIPEDAAAYSLNVNPLSQNGILNSINIDRFCFSSNNKEIGFSNPISWSYVGQSKQGNFQNVDKIYLNDISAFGTTASPRISFIGTKGKKETLALSDIQPFYEYVQYEKIDGNTSTYLFEFTTALGTTDTSYVYKNTTNAITRAGGLGDSQYTISGFDEGTATIKTVSATASDYDNGDNDTFTITTPDGRVKTYIFDDDNDGATGSVDGSSRIRVQLNGLSGQGNIAAQIKAAIEDADGHANRINITVSTTDNSNDTLTLVYDTKPLNEILDVGDYLSIFAVGSSFAITTEIMQVREIDTGNNTIYFNRGCFGTSRNTFATGTVFYFYSNRLTIDGIQIRTRKGIAKLATSTSDSTWSDYSGNHIGGNSHYLKFCNTANLQEEDGGKIALFTTNQSVTFSATAKTVTFGSAITDIPFYEGDYITFYHSQNYASGTPANYANNGFTSKIIKKATSPCVLTLETAPAEQLLHSTGTLYMEANLLKNHTFHHQVDTPTQTIVETDDSGNEEYKLNDWKHVYLYNIAGDYPSNLYGFSQYAEDTDITIVDSGGYWETTPGDDDVSGTTDNAASFYPFPTSDDKYVKITNGYHTVLGITLGIALTADIDNTILSMAYSSGGINSHFAKNDIILINDEYMKVTSVSNKELIVQRAILGSALDSHDAGDTVKKSINNGISQDVDKSRLKKNQPYVISFYAKDANASAPNLGYGALSIEFNGGYINSSGEWIPVSKNLSNGYIGEIDNITKEDRWIPFEELQKPNGDSGARENALDDIWRKFSLVFYPEHGKEFLTDMQITFASRGIDNSEVHIDLSDLSEYTRVFVDSQDSLFVNNSFIDNSGAKDLVSFDSKESVLKITKNIFDNSYSFDEPKSNYDMSDTVIKDITSSRNSATMVSNNREVHIGYGGEKSDSSPHWLGYLNHQLFGEDYTGHLYLDEDTVHTYDEETLGTMSKICLAGEHERISGTVSSTGSIGDSNTILTIAHTDHSMNVGDNIVVREWMDADNSWDGNGVWVVSTRTDDNNFICKRDGDFDKQPSATASNNLISYRPYFYYGIKDGDYSIYRIWPDTRIKSDLSADTTYTKGKIEKSLPLAIPITSIATCYNKDLTNGTEGGRVYVLSAISDEIYIYDVQRKWDEWETTELLEKASIDLHFKSFKWSNHTTYGDITTTKGVFGGLASETTPTIEYAGILSDIIETKGPTSDASNLLDADETANTGIALNNFDTRLWVQCRHVGEEGFGEGDRFLFCGKTETGNTNGPNTLYFGDRTPPTTTVMGCLARYDTGGQMFLGGPGTNPITDLDAGQYSHLPSDVYGNITNYSYFYHYYDDTDSKRKLSRLSVNSTWSKENNGHSGTIQAQHYDKPYINFGYNVGWNAENGMPSIKVAKYGMFQIADNDGDGLLDGTGVVVPNDVSITDTTNLTGPYGTLHQRVCSHAVGLIGGAETNWQRHWGRLHGRRDTGGDDYFISNHGSGNDAPTEDTPESMSVEKCVFISTDTHYGDNQPDQSYSYVNIENSASPHANNTSTLDFADDTDLTGLSEGDLCLLVDDNLSIDYKSCIIIKIDHTSDNKKVVTSIPWTDSGYLNSTAPGSGKLYPHTLHEFRSSGTYWGLLDTEKMFHYAYDEDDGLNGEIFTGIPGSGHFTKTYFTTPTYWGGPVYGTYGSDWGNADQFDRWNTANPGWVWPIEKLSFRGGVMMRPFDMEDEAFNDLVVGNGIYVDMPCFPNPVYHKPNSTKIHYDVGNSSPNNAYASKLFISCPRPQDTNQESSVYICDLNFMYPQQALQVEQTQDNGTATTNSWNYGISWDVCFSGTIGAYDTSDTNTDLEGNNALQPTLTLDISTFTGNNTNIWSTSETSSTGNSYYRTQNALYGLCISVMDSVTGTIQTRQIIGSKYDGSADMIVKVHYPFGHTLLDNTDKFWVWKHSLVTTAPIRLMKTVTLPHALGDALDGDPILSGPVYKNTGSITDLDSSSTTATATTSSFHNLTTKDMIEISEASTSEYDGVYEITVTGPKTFTFTISSDITDDNVTATWTLLPDSSSSAANPLSIPLTRPLMGTTFGGLDMRKLRTIVTNGTDMADSSGTTTVTSDANLLSTGDMVTLDDDNATTDYEGTFNLVTDTTDNFTVLNASATGDANDTNEYNINTNQWEMVIAGTAASSQMGELRAGFAQWDKGNIAANISRYDSTTDSDRYMSYGESSVRIIPVSLANQSGDFFLKNNRYYYKISYIYDGYQEGPLSNSYWSHYDTASRSKLSISLDVKKYSKRLTHVCIYRKDGVNAFYKLVKEIETKASWNKIEGGFSYTFGDEGDVGASYEARTGLPEIIDTIKIKYGLSAELEGYLFVADCDHEKVENASNQLFRSKPGMFSIFNYIYDYTILKSKPTALAAFNGRLYVFDENNIYTVNPHNLVIEDTFEGIGCIGKDSVVVTEFGMFFADKTGAYIHTGQTPVKISDPIQKGGNTEETFGGTDNIKDVSWENVVTNVEGSEPKVIFDSQLGSVLFNVSYKDSKIYSGSVNSTTYNVMPVTKQYIWSFNILRKRWDLWELSEDSEIGQPFTGDKGEIYYPINNSIYELRGGSINRDYTWISKKIIMGEPSIVKVFNKLKMNGITKDINLGGDNIESSDRLLVVSSSGTIASGDITSSVQNSGDIDYKLSGSNKKGRWLQFKLENMTEAIDAIGILYRRKSTK